ncbi:MAG TPA: tetrahydrofolate synthase [Lachnospiraceae bacterium]|nr:tetrahydrofolate synthase [Lachnospiraceae bacterium]
MQKKTDYQTAEKYISDIPKFTSKNSLGHTRRFLELLGCGEGMFPARIIHVAGTNGKGSVCMYLQELLKSEGRRVGSFFSPHLVKMNERIRIDGKEVSDEEFIESFQAVQRTIERMKAEGLAHPTFFEFLFGMAMWTFKEKKVEDIVLETGLGGRLDATNVFRKPALTVITSISMDHMQYLGNTIAEIAGEKAGIIKEGVPLVYDGTQEESARVLREYAAKRHAPCREIGKNAYEILKITEKDIAFSSLNAYYENTVWTLANPGIYQAENAMLALTGMEILYGEDKHLLQWQKVLAQVHWEGRMEEILPNVFLDGAHNIGAIEAFSRTLKAQHTTGKRVILFSAVKDKEYEEMIRCLCSEVQADTYILTEIEDKRKTEIETLTRLFRTYTDQKVIPEPSLKKAFETALAEKGIEGRLYCLGSLYLAGMLEELLGRQISC